MNAPSILMALSAEPFASPHLPLVSNPGRFRLEGAEEKEVAVEEEEDEDEESSDEEEEDEETSDK